MWQNQLKRNLPRVLSIEVMNESWVFFLSISWFELTETIYYHPQTQCLQELQQRKGCRWLRRGKRVRNPNLKTSKCFSVNPWCSVFVFHGFWYIMTKTTAMFQSIYRAQKKISAIGAWENSKKAAIEAELRQIEVINFLSSSNPLSVLRVQIPGLKIP